MSRREMDSSLYVYLANSSINNGYHSSRATMSCSNLTPITTDHTQVPSNYTLMQSDHTPMHSDQTPMSRNRTPTPSNQANTGSNYASVPNNGIYPSPPTQWNYMGNQEFSNSHLTSGTRPLPSNYRCSSRPQSYASPQTLSLPSSSATMSSSSLYSTQHQSIAAALQYPGMSPSALMSNAQYFQEQSLGYSRYMFSGGRIEKLPYAELPVRLSVSEAAPRSSTNESLPRLNNLSHARLPKLQHEPLKVAEPVTTRAFTGVSGVYSNYYNPLAEPISPPVPEHMGNFRRWGYAVSPPQLPEHMSSYSNGSCGVGYTVSSKDVQSNVPMNNNNTKRVQPLKPLSQNSSSAEQENQPPQVERRFGESQMEIRSEICTESYIESRTASRTESRMESHEEHTAKPGDAMEALCMLGNDLNSLQTKNNADDEMKDIDAAKDVNDSGNYSWNSTPINISSNRHGNSIAASSLSSASSASSAASSMSSSSQSPYDFLKGLKPMTELESPSLLQHQDYSPATTTKKPLMPVNVNHDPRPGASAMKSSPVKRTHQRLRPTLWQPLSLSNKRSSPNPSSSSSLPSVARKLYNTSSPFQSGRSVENGNGEPETVLSRATFSFHSLQPLQHSTPKSKQKEQREQLRERERERHSSASGKQKHPSFKLPLAKYSATKQQQAASEEVDDFPALPPGRVDRRFSSGYGGSEDMSDTLSSSPDVLMPARNKASKLQAYEGNTYKALKAQHLARRKAYSSPPPPRPSSSSSAVIASSSITSSTTTTTTTRRQDSKKKALLPGRGRKNYIPHKAAPRSDTDFCGVSCWMRLQLQNNTSQLVISAVFSCPRQFRARERPRRQGQFVSPPSVPSSSSNAVCLSSSAPQTSIQAPQPSSSSSLFLPPPLTVKHHRGPRGHANAGKQCASCSTRKTPLWRDAEDGTPLCNACGIRYKKYRLRCSSCWYIPRKDNKLQSHCRNCGEKLRIPALKHKVW